MQQGGGSDPTQYRPTSPYMFTSPALNDLSQVPIGHHKQITNAYVQQGSTAKPHERVSPQLQQVPVHQPHTFTGQHLQQTHKIKSKKDPLVKIVEPNNSSAGSNYSRSPRSVENSELTTSFDPMKDRQKWAEWRTAVNGRLFDNLRDDPKGNANGSEASYGSQSTAPPMSRFIHLTESSADMVEDLANQGTGDLHIPQFIYYGLPRVTLGDSSSRNSSATNSRSGSFSNQIDPRGRSPVNDQINARSGSFSNQIDPRGRNPVHDQINARRGSGFEEQIYVRGSSPVNDQINARSGSFSNQIDPRGRSPVHDQINARRGSGFGEQIYVRGSSPVNDQIYARRGSSPVIDQINARRGSGFSEQLYVPGSNPINDQMNSRRGSGGRSPIQDQMYGRRNSGASDLVSRSEYEDNGGLLYPGRPVHNGYLSHVGN